MPFSVADSVSFKNDWFDYNEPYPYPLHDPKTGASATFSYDFDEKTGTITISVNYIEPNKVNDKKIPLCIFEKDKRPRINRVTMRTVNSSELCLCINDRAHNALDNYGFFMHECYDYYALHREI